MMSKPAYMSKIISVEISQSGSHHIVYFIGNSQLFDHS